ncbi:ABC transporter substrate-binding protein [Microlunatus speluncae]|uniref:ABC transporter substrate-binding protein n=1 Tax=Microlunatus speluncae TaxID=2594267 RepID=UPI001FEA1450|nr:ABC transporter substrate-binding protein [Microlunatus speluncae]
MVSLRPLFAAVGAASLMLTACSVGSIGSSGDGSVEITYLVGNGAEDVAAAEALRDGFVAENPDIKVTIDTRPGGVEGDNLVKTRLSTGEMADVFTYNSGSLFQALNPDTNLAPLDDQPWVADLSEEFVPQVKTPKGIYGAPYGTSSAGGVMYNKVLYEELGLKIPTSWAEFMANNEKIKAAGKIAVAQTYGESWTAQLFVLGDFANVAVKDPKWAEEYTKNQRKYADQPALQGFVNQEQLGQADMYNKDFASAMFDEGIRLIATGEAAHYPITTTAVGTLQQNFPDNVDDVGVFALPAQDAASTRLTIWLPGAMYIPKTTTDAKLDAARKLIAFTVSAKGCAIQSEQLSIAGPYSISSCELPADIPAVAADVQRYTDEGKVGPALEFISPIKGPNLSGFTVEVGSGIRSAKEAAALYDQDVEKQAQQLGLPGW